MGGYATKPQSAWERLQDTSTIYFAKATWQELDLKETAKIDYLAKMLKADPETVVTLTGHASVEGSPEFNETLAINRATKVKTLLAANGIDPKMMTTKGAGTSMPEVRENGRTPEELENQRQHNRRVKVDFSFIPGGVDVRQFILTRAALFDQNMIKGSLKGERVVPYPRDPGHDPGCPPGPRKGLPDPKPHLKPDEWRAMVKDIQEALKFKGIQIDTEKIAEIIKEGMQLPEPDNQGPADEDIEKDQRQRQSPPAPPAPPD